MSHLIQAIDIEGTKYCVKHGAATPKWRTVSLLEPPFDHFELVGVEDDDKWRTTNPEALPFSNIVFATSCVWKITIRVTSNNPESMKQVEIVINNVSVNYTIFYDEGSVDIVIDLNALGLMGRPCGNHFRIYAEWTGFGEFGDELLVEILDVTFGPPV